MIELADGIGIVIVAVGVFAVGEALWTAAHLRRKPVDVIPTGRPFLGRDDWTPLRRPVAARHRARLPVRRRPGRWRRDADVPLLHHRAEAGRPARRRPARRVRRGRDRGRRRTRGRQQRQRGRHVRAAARARSPRDRDRLDPAGRAHVVRHRPGPDADGRAARPGVDAAGQPPDRQRAAAGHQPAARAALGEAAADPTAAAVRRHPVLRHPRRLLGELRPVRPRAAAVLRRRRVRDPAVRHPGAAADPRRHPRSPHGAEAARGARPVRRRRQRAVQRGRSRSRSTC